MRDLVAWLPWRRLVYHVIRSRDAEDPGEPVDGVMDVASERNPLYLQEERDRH